MSLDYGLVNCHVPRFSVAPLNLVTTGDGGSHKRQISKPPTPHPQVSISANNHNCQSYVIMLVAALADLEFGV